MVSVEVLSEMRPSSKSVLLVALVIAIAVAGVFAWRYYSSSRDAGKSRLEPLITEDQAISLAMETTEVSADDATVSKRELIYKGEKPQYRIQFSTNEGKSVTNQFVVSIDGLTGDVIQVQKTVASGAPSSSKGEKAEDKGDYDDPDKFIGVDKVMAIVLEDANLTESEAEFKSVKLNNRDEIMVYVAEFSSGDVDYKFFVDAVTGKVIERRVEYDED